MDRIISLLFIVLVSISLSSRLLAAHDKQVCEDLMHTINQQEINLNELEDKYRVENWYSTYALLNPQFAIWHAGGTPGMLPLVGLEYGLKDAAEYLKSKGLYEKGVESGERAIFWSLFLPAWAVGYAINVSCFTSYGIFDSIKYINAKYKLSELKNSYQEKCSN